ncbi:MAG: hypothetical protein AB7O24_07970 [Kofleriaceae bacterium]
MKLAIGSLSLALVLAFGVGCKKKDDKPAQPPSAEAQKLGDMAAKASGQEPAAAAPTPTAAAPAGDMTAEQACDKVVTLMTAMGAAIEGAKDNCDAMGAALEKVTAEHKAFIEWMNAADADPVKGKEIKEKCEAKVKPVMEKTTAQMQAAAKCESNERVKGAMSVFN